MKFTFTFIISFYLSISYCQTYSDEITNNEISEFFVQLNKSSKLDIKKINQEIIPWDDYRIYGETDSTAFGPFGNGILKEDVILKYLTAEDIKYIEKQYLSIKKSSWKKSEFKKFELIDSTGLNEIHKYSMKRNKKIQNYYAYSFSLPFFSLNKKYAIIIQDYYCGFMCSTQCFYLYRKNLLNNWIEIESWNCLSL